PVRKLVTFHQLYAVDGFPIYTVGFSPYMVGNSRCSEQISLICAIHIHLSLDHHRRFVCPIYRLKTNGRDICSSFLHVHQHLSVVHLCFTVFHIPLEKSFGDFWLKYPLFKSPVVFTNFTIEI